ncbi:unnamed protein product [Rotaria sp. Silwood2]|nr:unnamed protein product [Rotaria sp. Silwood2]CAF3019548.1 unnamed protein product [Rotaria sp. Silwood2]CAF3337106.1 unnamed protein product [Rotaria sp. Silwood2]CAF3472057.1 unnamed protein product [Rotaria sp. Silwood2]CAF4310176.1 unnamed protein product [Rotaria sp. Silwood2]
MSTTVANDLEKKIVNWLDAHGNRFELDIYEGSLRPLTPTIYTHSSSGTSISIGFKNPLQQDTVDLEELRRNFSFIALDRLPLADLDVPSNWQVYPQTPVSSFDEGVHIDAYENNRLRMTISTRFFAIYGSQKQEHPIMDKAADEGTYLQVRRDIEGVIKLDLPLVIE